MKLIALIALCTSYFIYADGYADLVAIQKNFPRLISQQAHPGVIGASPEVPYIAGILGDSRPLDGDLESARLKEVLYTMGQAGAAASHAEIDFTPLNIYNKYTNTGHSTFGIAAQERVDLRPAPLLSSPPPPPPPMPLGSTQPVRRGGPPAPPPPPMQGDDAAARPDMASLLAGFGGFKKKAQPQEDTAAATAAPAPLPAPIGKSLLERVQEKLTALRTLPASKDNIADIAILEMLAAELMAPAVAKSAEEAEKVEGLKEFFALLENPPTSQAGQAKVGRLRMMLKPKQTGAVAFAVPVVNPVEAAIEEAVNTNFDMAIPRAIIDNKKAISEAIRRIKALGVDAKDFQKRNLINLSRRHALMADDGDEDESDSGEDDIPPVAMVKPKLKPVVAAQPQPDLASAAPSATMFTPVLTPDPVIVTQQPAPAGVASVLVAPQQLIPAVVPPSTAISPVEFPSPPLPTAPSGDGIDIVDIDTWAEQEFQREKQAIQDQIDALNAIDVNALPLKERLPKRQEITRLQEPLSTELAKYNNSFGKDRIIREIKKRYPHS